MGTRVGARGGHEDERGVGPAQGPGGERPLDPSLCAFCHAPAVPTASGRRRLAGPRLAFAPLRGCAAFGIGIVARSGRIASGEGWRRGGAGAGWCALFLKLHEPMPPLWMSVSGLIDSAGAAAGRGLPHRPVCRRDAAGQQPAARGVQGCFIGVAVHWGAGATAIVGLIEPGIAGVAGRRHCVSLTHPARLHRRRSSSCRCCRSRNRHRHAGRGGYGRPRSTPPAAA